MSLRNKTAFITGGAQGLGEGFAEALLKQGAKVCISDIQNIKGKEVEKRLSEVYGAENVLYTYCDVTSDTSFKQAFDLAVNKFGTINIMVNNAGIADESSTFKMIAINLYGVVLGTKIAMDHMDKSKGGFGGKIVNISSTAGLTGVYFSPVYCASKFGVVGFHSSCATNPHHKRNGLEFVCLCPAFTDTPILEFNSKKILHHEEGFKIMKQIGINSVEAVVSAFIQLVVSDNCNGDILKVTANEGTVFVKKGLKTKSSL